MTLLVAREQVEAHKLLVAVANVAAENLFGVICVVAQRSAMSARLREGSAREGEAHGSAGGAAGARPASISCRSPGARR